MNRSTGCPRLSRAVNNAEVREDTVPFRPGLAPHAAWHRIPRRYTSTDMAAEACMRDALGWHHPDTAARTCLRQRLGVNMGISGDAHQSAPCRVPAALSRAHLS